MNDSLVVALKIFLVILVTGVAFLAVPMLTLFSLNTLVEQADTTFYIKHSVEAYLSIWILLIILNSKFEI